MNPDTPQPKSNRRILVWSGVVVVGMFLFALFVLPPMYDVFCKLTGLNGKVPLVASQAPANLPNNSSPNPLTTKNSAAIKMQLLANTGTEMPWTFKPDISEMMVIPGKVYQTHFYVKNLSDQPMTGRAVPSVAPAIMHLYLKKIECFCFQEQHLAPGEEKHMALRFYLSQDTPKDVRDFTLSYTLYKVTPSQSS